MFYIFIWKALSKHAKIGYKENKGWKQKLRETDNLLQDTKKLKSPVNTLERKKNTGEFKWLTEPNLFCYHSQ